MQTITVEEIDGKLKTLSEDKLTAVYHFVSFLADSDLELSEASALETALLSENRLPKIGTRLRRMKHGRIWNRFRRAD